jgi:hypothetical protein
MRTSLSYCCVTLLFFSSPVTFLLAQNDLSLPRVVAVETPEPPIIDGRVDDEVWDLANVIDTFIQRRPDEGEPATERTEVRILYDNNALYISFICYDSNPEGIVRRLTRRDRDIPSDRVSVGIDSDFDRRSSFVFEVNAAGVKRDFFMYDDGNEIDINWEGIWDAEVTDRPDGWSAEFKIPYQTLRFSEGDDLIWGINFSREIDRKNEWLFWSLIPRAARGWVSRFGILEGLQNINPPRSLLFLPYMLGGGTSLPSGQLPAHVHSIDPEFRAGLDFQYGISNNTTLNITVNPDFGQVELDEVVLNLTAFETFFPEKRPFFLERASLFENIGANFGEPIQTWLFYSRRIGRQPSRYHTWHDTLDIHEWKIESNTSVTPILAAGKLTGRTDTGYEFGVINATTARTHKVLKGPDGDRIRMNTENLANYSVARGLYQLPGPASYLGGIVTGVLREGTDTPQAYSGGFDWQYNTEGYGFTTNGLLATTYRTSGEETERGYQLFANTGFMGGDAWIGNGGIGISTEGFNANDIGFNVLNNYALAHSWIQYRKLEVFGPVREFRFNQNYFYVATLEPWQFWIGGINPNISIQWKNYWSTNIGLNAEVGGGDLFESRGMGLYMLPNAANIWINGSTDSRKKVVIRPRFSYSFDEYGKRMWSGGLPLSLQAGYRTELSVSPSVSVRRDETGWVSNVRGIAGSEERVSVFGHRNVDQLNLILRATHTFTRDLTVQIYGQYFWARGRYTEFFRLLPDGNLTKLGEPYDRNVYPNPDFNRSNLNLNFILRYEYRPGSTIFLVWTHGRSVFIRDVEVGAGGLINHTWTTPSTDVLMLKMSYAIGL